MHSDIFIRIVSEARKKLDIIGDVGLPQAIVDTPEYKAALTFAKERGVRLRLIADITSKNLDACVELMRVAELRHLGDMKGSVVLSENDCILAVSPKAEYSFQGKQKRRNLIYTERHEMVEHQQCVFDKLWSIATIASQRINAMETGNDSTLMEILHNRERAENLLISAIKGAKTEVLIAFNSLSYLSHLANIGLIDRIEQAKSAGSVILVLCPHEPGGELTQSDSEASRLLSDMRRYCEIRNLAGGLTGTMAVIDNKTVIAMSDEEMEAVTLFTNDRAIVNNFASLFGALWTEKDLFQNLVRTKNALANSNAQLVEANARLKENDSLQKEFINIAAHELRTPVQPILGMIELLSSGSDKGAITIGRDEIELLSRNAKRLEALSSDLLEVSRIESNSFKLNPLETIDLEEKVTQVINDVRSFTFTRPNLKITLVKNQDSDGPIPVNVDVNRISEVLFNLLGNAIKFTEQGEIAVTVERSEREAIVTVTDTGSGIDPDVIPKLFTKFAPKSQSGTGLGLFISKSIVEAHGGKIWGGNNMNGTGATFGFSIPLAMEAKIQES